MKDDKHNANIDTDEKTVMDRCQQVIEKHPDKVEMYLKDKTVLGFLVEQVMKLSGGSVHIKDVHVALVDLLEQNNKVPAIYFYSSRAKYGFMSNFARYPITIDGIRYETSEHYYQSMKFVGTKWEKKVRDAKTPMEAATLGRNKKLPLRRDWESVKDNVMRKVVEAKFKQHLDLAKKLLETGEVRLVEKTTDDLYWGCGDSGKGKNMLGVILMEVRAKLRKEQ